MSTGTWHTCATPTLNRTPMFAFLAFINGLALMVMEMAGARLLAPWLGTSVVVWTSIIGIILACLSLGNWFGGRLADRVLAQHSAAKKAKDAESGSAFGKARHILSGLFSLAAFFVVLCVFFNEALLQTLASSGMPLHGAAPLAALLLFGTPSLVCGMVSPYIARLAIYNHPAPGAVIGRLSAIATVGSIAGTFLGGFVLISLFGSASVLLGVAACFLVAGFSLSIKKPGLKVFLLFAVVGVGYVLQLEARALEESGGRNIETSYNFLKIREATYAGRPAMVMQTDPGAYQSACFVHAPAELAFDYTKFYALGTYTRPEAKRILMLGGGGYSVPKWLLAGESGLASPNFHLDVVELDPGITKAAEDFFSLPKDDARMTIFHEDARTFLNRQAALPAEPYDLVFGDVFSSAYTVPFHVGTAEAAAKIHTLLAPDGLFVMNIISAIEGDKGQLLRALAASFATVFPTVELYQVHANANPALVQNVMLVASKTDGTPFATPHPRIFQLVSQRLSKPLATDTPALTDDFAPVEKYTIGMTR